MLLWGVKISHRCNFPKVHINWGLWNNTCCMVWCTFHSFAWHPCQTHGHPFITSQVYVARRSDFHSDCHSCTQGMLSVTKSWYISHRNLCPSPHAHLWDYKATSLSGVKLETVGRQSICLSSFRHNPILCQHFPLQQILSIWE